MAQDNNIAMPQIGLDFDHSNELMPDKAYRYALNAVMVKDGVLETEKSTAPCNANINGVILGHIELTSTEVIVWNDNDNYTHITEVEYDGSTCSIVNELVFDCQLFDNEHAVHGTWHLLNGCDTWLYITNGYDPIARIKLDNTYYDLNSDGRITNCNEVKLQKDIVYPRFSEVNVAKGGSLYSGSYNFAIRYLDDGGNKTAWLVVSLPVSIYYADDKPYYETVGNRNINGPSPHVYGLPKANKKIELIIDRLDINWTYYQIAVIRAISGSEHITDVLISQPVHITDEISTFVYDGNDSSYEEGDIDEINFNQYQLSTIQAITNYDNRLILGNVRETKRDLCTLNKYAISTRVEYITNDISLSVDDKKNTKAEEYTFTAWGFMPGEVYALGLIYVFDNGDISPVFHIPGRPANSDDRSGVAGDVNQFDTNLTERWQIYDTSTNNLLWYYEEADNVYEINTASEVCCSNMWEQKVAPYPEINADTENLLGKNIRHHRIPTRAAEPQATYTNNVITYCTLFINIDTAAYNDGAEHTVEIEYSDCDGVSQTKTLELTINSDVTTVEILTCESDCASSIASVDSVIIDGNDATFTSNTEESTTTYSNRLYHNIGLRITVQIPSGHNIQGVILVRGIIKNNFVIDHGYITKTIPAVCQDAGVEPGALFDGSCVNHAASFDSINLNASKVMVLCDDCTRCNGCASDHYDANYEYNTHTANIISYFSQALGLFDYSKPTYIKTLNIVGTAVNRYNCRIQRDTWDCDGGICFNGCTNHTVWRHVRTIAYTNPSSNEGNYKINKKVLVNSASKLNGSIFGLSEGLVNNVSQSNKILALQLDRSIQLLTNRAFYTALMTHHDNAYGALDSIQYIPISNGVLKVDPGSNTFNVWGGGSFIGEEPLFNDVIRWITHAWDGADIAGLSQKHAIVTAYTYKKTSACGSKSSRQNKLAGVSNSDDSKDCCANWEQSKIYHTPQLDFYLPQDSWINVGLMHDYHNAAEVYAKYASSGRSCEKHFFYHVLRREGSNDCELGGAYDEYWSYNYAYSRQDLGKTYASIPYMFDICSDCINKFPYSIFWSQRQLEENSIDQWTQLNPLDYTNIPSDTGEIHALRSDGNKLWVWTDNAVYYFPMPTQELISSDMSLYVGTGSFLSVGPYKLPYEFGMQDAISIIWSQIGFIFIDYIRNKIYNLNSAGQVNILSDILMTNFFNENEFVFSANPYRFLGTILGIDSEYNRILITSKPSREEEFTLSFDIARKTWISFHSYYPNIYLNSNNKMLTLFNSTLYLHNVDNSFLNIYETQQNFEVELVFVANPLTEKVYNDISLYTKTYKFNSNSFEQVKDVTFNKYNAYTSKQATGEINLLTIYAYGSDVMHNMIAEASNTHFANYVENRLVISKLDDLHEQGTDLFVKHRGRYIVNSAAINYNKDWWTIDKLRDKFIGLLLIYESSALPNDNDKYKIEVYAGLVNDKYSLR